MTKIKIEKDRYTYVFMAKEIKIFQPFKVEKKKEKKKRKNKIESFLTQPNAEMVIDKKRNR